MKKFKLIICSLMAALALTGCNGAKKAGVLPSGGKTVDLSTEEGVAALKSNLEKTTEAYKNLEIYALGLKSETKGLLNIHRPIFNRWVVIFFVVIILFK